MKTILKRCIEGDRIAQKELYNKYSPVMFNICRKYTKTKQDAEDALQNGFIKIFMNLTALRNEEVLEGWMKRIFLNECLSMLRLIKNYEDFKENLRDNSATGLQKLYEQDIKKEIKGLPEGYREIFQMFFDGYSHKEIGSVLDINQSTSKSQYYRARKFLMHRVA